MEEPAVREWLVSKLDVSRETLERLELFAAMLLAEAEQQNLIARSTTPSFWDRHIRDSAQLLLLASPEQQQGKWLDIGSGPGLPGIVLAIVGPMPITLVEERRRRAEFLATAVERLDLGERVTVEGRKLERMTAMPYDVVTARAFAPLPKLFDLAHRFSGSDTLWLLPKGKTVDEELAAAQRVWQGQFDTVQSQTDSLASIITARNVRPRSRK